MLSDGARNPRAGPRAAHHPAQHGDEDAEERDDDGGLRHVADELLVDDVERVGREVQRARGDADGGVADRERDGERAAADREADAGAEHGDAASAGDEDAETEEGERDDRQPAARGSSRRRSPCGSSRGCRPSPRMTTLSMVGISSAAPRPRSIRFCLTRSTTAPSWMPTPSSVRTTSPPPSEVETPTRARCAARVAVAHTSEKASDSTTRVTVVVTRLSSPFAAGASSSWSASAARGGRPRSAMPSNTLEVISWKSTWALIASIDSSMIIACTAGSSTSGASVATNASSSTSCTRAHAPTIETGTRIVGDDDAQRGEERAPPSAATARRGRDLVRSDRSAFGGLRSRRAVRRVRPAGRRCLARS